MRTPKFWTRRTGTSRLIADVLTPLGWVYGRVTAWRAAQNWTYRARARVICVGNLTVGGNGKTPVAIAVADMVAKRGVQPFFLSRGYGGKQAGPVQVDQRVHTAKDIGDEPLLLAQYAPCVVARDKAFGAEFADRHGADVIVMDDGHQNPVLRKHLSVVVVDAQTGFGNRKIVPAGPLREPVLGGLRRAHAVILVGEGSPRLYGFRGQIFRVRLQPHIDPDLKVTPLLAFAGIGHPRKFMQSLRDQGLDVKALKGFPDHHRYSSQQIARLHAKAKSIGARLVTTEKDYVRLPPKLRKGISFVPIRAAFDDPEGFEALLDRQAIPKRSQ